MERLTLDLERVTTVCLMLIFRETRELALFVNIVVEEEPQQCCDSLVITSYIFMRDSCDIVA